MNSITVALVEDDVDLAEEIGFQLQYYGMTVTVFNNGKTLESWLKENKCDVLLLDLNLPGEDGLSIAKRLSERADFRIVMLTARVMTNDRIAGFDAGADVYLQKPVDLAELVSVIRRVTKRLSDKPQLWQLNPVKLLLISPQGETIKLTTKEINFLQLLSRAENNYLTRQNLEEQLWGTSDIYITRRLEVLVSRLRQKLASFNDELIQTYWREGYGLTVSLEVLSF